MNLYPLGDLQNAIDMKIKEKKNFSLNEIKRFIGCTILSVYYLNSQKIYHRDLKPANILLTKNCGKIYLHLNDFGTAMKATD